MLCFVTGKQLNVLDGLGLEKPVMYQEREYKKAQKWLKKSISKIGLHSNDFLHFFLKYFYILLKFFQTKENKEPSSY